MKKQTWGGIALALCLAVSAAQAASAPDMRHLRMGAQGDAWNAVVATDDGHVLLAGMTVPEDTALSQVTHGAVTLYAADGDRALWSKTLGGGGQESFSAAVQTADGGWLLAGSASSDDTDTVTGWHAGWYDDYSPKTDGWAVRLSAAGDVLWSKCYGGSDWDAFHAVCAVEDGFVLAGYTSSHDGDVEGFHAADNGFAYADAWAVCIDADGNMRWQRTMGEARDDKWYAVARTARDTLLLAGETSPTEEYGRETDAWLAEVSTDGDILRTWRWGGEDDDGLRALALAADGGCLAVGRLYSQTGDVPETDPDAGHTLSDGWAVRLSSEGDILWQTRLGGEENEGLSGVCAVAEGWLIVGNWAYPDENGTEGYVALLGDDGELRWQADIGGTGEDALHAVACANARAYAAGVCRAVDGQTIDFTGSGTAWLARWDMPPAYRPWKEHSLCK